MALVQQLRPQQCWPGSSQSMFMFSRCWTCKCYGSWVKIPTSALYWPSLVIYTFVDQIQWLPNSLGYFCGQATMLIQDVSTSQNGIFQGINCSAFEGWGSSEKLFLDLQLHLQLMKEAAQTPLKNNLLSFLEGFCNKWGSLGTIKALTYD